jgi:hypothetical protein
MADPRSGADAELNVCSNGPQPAECRLGESGSVTEGPFGQAGALFHELRWQRSTKPSLAVSRACEEQSGVTGVGRVYHRSPLDEAQNTG